jgi:hypothetical protein
MWECAEFDKCGNDENPDNTMQNGIEAIRAVRPVHPGGHQKISNQT